MDLTNEDQLLIQKARELYDERKVTGGIIGEVGAALRTKSGLTFLGISLDLWCGIGFCAEHSAVANMVSHSKETQIETIVAVGGTETGEVRVIWPCGRCRQMLEWMDERNLLGTWVITSETEKRRLIDLLPQRTEIEP